MSRCSVVSNMLNTQPPCLTVTLHLPPGEDYKYEWRMLSPPGSIREMEHGGAQSRAVAPVDSLARMPQGFYSISNHFYEFQQTGKKSVSQPWKKNSTSGNKSLAGPEVK